MDELNKVFAATHQCLAPDMARLCSGRYLKSSSRIYYTEIIIEKKARVECPATRVQNCFQSSQRVIEGAKLQRLPGRLVRRAQEESPLARNDPTFCISPKSATHLKTLDPTLCNLKESSKKTFISSINLAHPPQWSSFPRKPRFVKSHRQSKFSAF
jgi:hypothetical protein